MTNGGEKWTQTAPGRWRLNTGPSVPRSTGKRLRRGKNYNTIHLPGMSEAVRLPDSKTGARDAINRLVDKHLPHMSGRFTIRGGGF